MPTPTENKSGLDKKAYAGGASTLCTGCGHDSITAAIIHAYWEADINPYNVAKMSGIGCSSKTPAYFLNKSHGFNAIHGRMPAVATGASLGNHQLHILGVSGDGDTASIGMGQFVHMVRRNIDMTYLIENNGTYGLTKGQFSATADLNSTLKSGAPNILPPVDICELAIQLDCSFVARSFAGDRKQLIALIKAAHSHKGTAIIDVLSPCVTFNDHEGSTKSYKYIRDHYEALAQETGYIPAYEEISVDYKEGEDKVVTLHDGSHLLLSKLHKEYDPTQKLQALEILSKNKQEQRIVTGLVYYNSKAKDFGTLSNFTDTPLAQLESSVIRPTKEVLSGINQSLR
jgi:2-oxoglutarate/2-oxoacid ferredoxin oxidoreductase subunit beta